MVIRQSVESNEWYGIEYKKAQNEVPAPKKDEFIKSASSDLPLPTKGYVDNVIKDALKNIKEGVNVQDNRRIVTLYSNIIGENPFIRELNEYYG